MESYYSSSSLVATTALGISHPIFQQRHFDYCIVDEASQMALPVCIGPLLYADKFVLVGDPYQLPPIFGLQTSRSEPEASLFKLLCKNSNAVVQLCTQYRMNEDIMSLTNELIYNNQLQCGSERVQKSTFECPLAQNVLRELHQNAPSSCWLSDILDQKYSLLNPANLSFL